MPTTIFPQTTASFYQRDEMMSSTEIPKRFGSVLDTIVLHKKSKIVILRNNKAEAVILSATKYEKMAQAAEILEELEILDILKKRRKDNIKNGISLEDLLAEHKLSVTN
jgi:PHD/YefM family antitoxin component YafN of YafNO toxin-antitoxin module